MGIGYQTIVTLEYHFISLPEVKRKGSCWLVEATKIAKRLLMSGDVASRVLVIGISGTTNSGKTTLVQRLFGKYRNSFNVVCQDDFFLSPGDPRLAPIYLPDIRHHNWEDFRALEMDRMVETVKDRIKLLEGRADSEQKVLFVDGFSIFGWKPLLPLLNKKYFIKVDKDICQARRSARHYDPPDVPGYFEAVVWPEHIKHLDAIREQQDIVYVDGNGGVESLYNLICTDISDQLIIER